MSSQRMIFCTKQSLLHIHVLLHDYRSLEKCLQTQEYDINNGNYMMSFLEETKPFNGWTPLHVSAATDDLQSAKLLLRYGADINARTGTKYKKSFTALHFAVKIESQEMCQLLIEWKADLNAEDSNRKTPLELCIRSPSLSTLLVKSGADYKNQHFEKYPLIFRAIKEKNLSLVELLAQQLRTGVYYEKKSPIEEAMNVFPECLPHLINAERQLYFKNSETGEYPIHLAVRMKQFLWIKMLCEKSVGTNVPNKEGNRPLHIAVQTECPKEIVILLISFGANPNLKNNNRLTPVCVAVENGNEELTQVLMNMGTRLSANLLELERGIRFKKFKSALIILKSCQTFKNGLKFDSEPILWFFVKHCVGEQEADTKVMAAIMQKLIDLSPESHINTIDGVWGSLMHFLIYADICSPTPCLRPLFNTLIRSLRCDINFVFEPKDARLKNGEEVPVERIMANGTALSFALEMTNCELYAEQLITMGADHSKIKWDLIYFSPKKIKALKMLVCLGSIPHIFREESNPIYDESLNANQFDEYSKEFKGFIEWWDRYKTTPLTLKQSSRNAVRKAIGCKGCRLLATKGSQVFGPGFESFPRILNDFILYKDFE